MGVVFGKCAHLSSLGALTGNVIPVAIPADPKHDNPNPQVRSPRDDAKRLGSKDDICGCISISQYYFLNDACPGNLFSGPPRYTWNWLERF
jgi:hypothetical protein